MVLTNITNVVFKSKCNWLTDIMPKKIVTMLLAKSFPPNIYTLYCMKLVLDRVEWIIVKLNQATNTSFCQMCCFWQSRVLWKLLSCEPYVHVYSRLILKLSKLIHGLKKERNSITREFLGLLDTAAYFLSNNLLDLFTIFSRKYAKVNCVW